MNKHERLIRVERYKEAKTLLNQARYKTKGNLLRSTGNHEWNEWKSHLSDISIDIKEP